MATTMSSPRAVHNFVSPVKEVNTGIWCLFGGTTVFLAFRLWCKLARRSYGLWWDDWILVVCWIVLLTTNIIISVEMGTGYVTKTWDDRMLILITISSCGTTFGQTWSKTAFAVTLLRITNKWQKTVLWIGIGALNVLLVLKVFVNWAKYCDQRLFQQSWRMQGFCIDYELMKDIKAAGNVWNIVMDFVLALFPWLVIWKLNIRKWEKVGLCATMSLGVGVAVVSAVRQMWMDDPVNTQYDDWYFWHQGLSMVWYSSEVAGTIMVQCIPVMRSFMVEVGTIMTSRRLTDVESTKSSQQPSTVIRRQRTIRISNGGCANATEEQFEMEDTFMQRRGSISHASWSPSEVDRAIEASRTRPLEWPPRCGIETVITAGLDEKGPAKG